MIARAVRLPRTVEEARAPARPGPSTNAAESDHGTGYSLLRLTMGVNLLLHGLVRLPRLGEFTVSLVDQFKNTPLPAPLVSVFAYGLPFVETAIGVSLTFGIRTRWGAIAGALAMTALVFGTALRSDWNTLGAQMIYVVVYYLLIAGARFDAFSIDRWMVHRRARL